MNRFAALALVLGALHGVSAPAQSPDTRIRAVTQPADGAWLAQEVRLLVEVSTDTSFRAQPDFPEIEIEGAIVLSPEVFPVNFTRDRGARRYSGQRRTYLVFPQRSGPLRVPPITVGMTVADGASGRRELQMSTPPMTLDVAMPPGAGDLEAFVSVPALEVEERYTPDLPELRVGDAFTRIVTVTASDTLALVLPGVDFPAPDGVAVYRHQPSLTDSVNGGRYSGRRVDSATYVFEEEGGVTLPPLTTWWWNTATNSLQSETLPGLRLEVGPAAVVISNRAPGEEEVFEAPAIMRLARALLDWAVAHAEFLTLAVGFAYLTWLALRQIVPAFHSRAETRRMRRRRSEAIRWRRFAVACRGGDEGSARRAFWRWVDMLDSENAAGRAFSEIWGEFAARRYGPERSAGQMDTRRLLRAARDWRRKERRRSRSRYVALDRRLNPRSE